MKQKFECIFLVDTGIGNAIQTLYALEYLLRQKISAGIYLGGINQSFQGYLKHCYGEAVIENLEEVSTIHLIHGFTYQREKFPSCKHYYYVNADYHSSKQVSETEQFINLVEGLFPQGERVERLTYLKPDYSKAVSEASPEGKVILYPGGSAINAVKRWPHFKKLFKRLGNDRVLVIGGKDDLNFEMSFVFPKWLAAITPQTIMNRKVSWKFLKKLRILKKHAHWPELGSLSNSYIEKFSWGELVALMKSSQSFVGNDGGLTHLAAAVGLRGIVFFGPTSEAKNKSIYSGMKPITLKLPCSPCQFGVGGIKMTTGHINCPYQVSCLSKIGTEEIIKRLDG